MLGGKTDAGFPIVITTMPANARHYKIATGGLIIVVAVIAIIMPFAAIRLPRVDAFIPVIQTLMCVVNLLTAALLFAHYRVQPQSALLALAGGFITSGLFAFLHTLAFPEAYDASVLIGDRLNSAGWLFIFWHTVFPLAVIVYTLWKDEGDAVPSTRRSTKAAVAITIACAITATAGLLWLATTGVGYLPILFETEIQRGPFTLVWGAYLFLLTAIALGFLVIRRHTILDQWLIVTLSSWLPNFLVIATTTVARFSLGWYMARVYALLAGSSLLFLLLTETLYLYVRLANAVILLRRERADRLAVFNTVVDGIITIDRSGLVQTLNPAAARLFGYAPEEVIGRNVKLLMPEPYRPEHDSYLANYLETGQAKMIGSSGRELTGKRKDGSIFPIELAVGEVDVAGRRMFTGVVRDITERKRAEMHIAADLDAMKRLHRVGVECTSRKNELKYCLERILEAAVAIAGANKGTIQLFDRTSGTLTLAAQIGFGEPFVTYFSRVSEGPTSCGAAMLSRERVIVEDVTLSEVFAGKPTLNLLLDARVRAVTSVPLISSSSNVLGMFSTHFSMPHQPGARELHLLDLLARQAADYLERRIAEEHQKTLMAELDHRVKNVLARVAAVADSTHQSGGSIDEFIRSFNGRIQSMAAAHSLLSQTGWQGTDLTALLRNQLAPYTDDANITIAGKDIMLGAAATQALAMVVHELVTNAVKYGALSIPGGRVSVSWDRRLNGGAATNLVFLWRELDGPPTAATIQPGYGTSLILELIPHELGGNVDLAFASDGACCRIEFPL